MPTSYTDPVGKGEITTLHDFAMLCARAMGATIAMRDEPLSTPVPERFEPDTRYDDEQIQKAMERLRSLADMTGSAKAAAAHEAFEARHKAWAERVAEKAALRARYNTMADLVGEWQVPPDLVEMKKFMLNQLVESLDFDCGHPEEDHKWNPEPVEVGPDIWHAKEVEEAAEKLARSVKRRGQEIERTEGRNAWLARLREALPPVTNP